MAKIDLEKVLIALLDSPFNKQFDDKVKDALKEQNLEYKDGEIVKIQKPKFNVGDWIVSSWGSFWRIKGIDQFYLLEGIDGREAQRSIYWVNNTFHNWTIQDAKPGDVLACNTNIFIYQELDKYDIVKSFCDYRYPQWDLNPKQYGFNNIRDSITYGNKCKPATNAQRALLFQKMKEAGYEWDTYKLELKKVDNRFDYENANIQQKDYSPTEDEELFFGDFRKTDSEDKGKASFANRQAYNQAILRILSNYIKKYPNVRFVEMLCNLGFHLDYMEESQITYLDLNKIIDKRK